MTTHRCLNPTDVHGHSPMRAHIIDMALSAVEAPDDDRCPTPTCPGERVACHLRESITNGDLHYVVAVASVALRMLGEAHRDGAAALIEAVTQAIRDADARPACSCCNRKVAPLTDGRCGHCDNRCADGSCSLRKPPSGLGESS